MNWLKRKAAEVVYSTTSAGAEWLARNGYPRMASNRLMGGPTAAGIVVNEESAKNLAVVNACIRVISDPVGFLPLHIYERVKDDERRLAREVPLYSILHDSPAPWLTAVGFRQLLQQHLLTYGNAYAQIIRRSGTDEVAALLPMDPSSVEPRLEGQRKVFKVTMEDGKPVDMEADVIWHIPGLGFDGVKGYSVIQMARETMGLTRAMEVYGASFFGNGGRVPYVLKHPIDFATDQEFDQFKERWQAGYGNSGAFHSVPILTGGLEYQQIGFKPDDAQLLASREFQVLEVARWFKVSPHKLMDLSRATFSNIEHLNIEFLTETLAYWLKLWEQSIWLGLFNASERKKYYAEFNADAILRGDAKSTAEAMSIQIQNSLLQPNEGRAMYNRPAVKGGDINLVQLNMQSLPGQPELAGQKQKGSESGPKTTQPSA